MPRLRNIVPKYRKHRASGQAVVTLNHVDHYLGPYGTKTSKMEYDRLIAEWLQRGRTIELNTESITIAELVLKFFRWGKVHYRRAGQPTGTLDNHKLAFRVLRKFYGRKLANEFGPKKLKTLQNILIKSGLSRRTINDRIGAIKLLFRWGVSEQLVSPMVSHALATVRGLAKHRSLAKETALIRPVDELTIEATLPHLPSMVADMVRLQRLTGMRPAEVCQVRPCDIDNSGDVWIYRPESHKTEHHGHERLIAIGPQGQAVLRPYLVRDKATFCFSPMGSERKRQRDRHEQRVTPLTCGNRPGTNRTRKPQRTAGDVYTTDSYRRAIHRAADKANVKRWHPNQLRHAAATLIRAQFGLEAAQIALGHSKADVTQVYAQRDMRKALEVARSIG